MPGYVSNSHKSVFMVYIERRVGVSCSVYGVLHTDAKAILLCVN